MKKFKEFICEMADGEVRMDSKVVFKKGPFAVINSKHGTERVQQRNTLSTGELSILFSNIIEKVKNMPEQIGKTFLFFSKSLHQGIVAAWDAVRKAVRIITFLPRDKHFAKPGTEEVVVEGITYSNLVFIEID